MKLQPLTSQFVGRVLAHSGLTIGVISVLVGLSLWGLLRTRIDSSLSAMMGSSSAAARALAHVAEDFQSSESIIVLVNAPGSAAMNDARSSLLAYADRFSEAVLNHPDASEFVEAIRFEPDASFERFVREILVPHGVLYLSDEEFAAFVNRFQSAEISAQMAHNEAMLAAPGPQASSIAKELIQDPLRLRDFVQRRSGSDAQQYTQPWISNDGRALLIRISGRQAVNDIAFSKAFVAFVHERIAESEPGDLMVRVGGGYAIAATAATSVRSDAIVSTTSSIGLLLVFFVIAYRSPWAALQIGLAAGIGIFIAFGLFAGIVGALTPLTAVCAAMLAGLGVDYAIHFRAHQLDLSLQGARADDASMQTAGDLALPMLGALVTTVFGFGALALGEVRLLRDFAILGSMGLIGSLVSVIVVLPLVLRLSSGRAQPSLTYRLSSWYVQVLTSRARPVLATSSVLGLLGFALILLTPGIVPEFESDSSVMHPQPNEALAVSEEVQERFSLVGDQLFVLVEADSPDELIGRTHLVRQALAGALATEAGIRTTRSLADLLPDPVVARRRLDDLASLDVDQMVSNVERGIEESVFEPTMFADYLSFLHTVLTVSKSLGIESLEPYDMLNELFVPHTHASNSTHSTLIYVAVDPQRFSGSTLSSAIAETSALVESIPGVTVTGVSVVAREMEQAARRDLVTYGGFSAIFVLGWLGLLFRRFVDVAMGLVPVVFGFGFVIAIMSVLGERLNVVSIAAVPLLAGIAVDSGIFLVLAVRRSRAKGGDPSAALIPTVHAIFCTGVTTVIGFGSLVFTQTPAVRTLGLAAVIGIVASAIGALGLLLPWALLRVDRAKRS